MLTACAALFGGCGGSEAPPAEALPPQKVERIEPYELAQLVASRQFEAIAIAPGGAILARDSARRALLFPAGERRPRELFRDARLEALALYPDGVRVLVAERTSPGIEPSRLFRLEPSGARTALPIVPAGPRFLGWRGDGGAFFVSGGSRDAAGGESIFELDAQTLVAQSAGEFPPGFQVEALSADGRLMALRRELHPEADELYLGERATGEVRLMLPAEVDARFRPVAFSADGRRLLLLTDESSERLQLEWLELESGARRRLPAPACEPIAARLVEGGAEIVATTSCAGARRVERLDAESGARLPEPPLPAGARALDLIVASGGAGPAVWTAGDARLPRDLLRQGAPDAALEPLTWGLSPGIDPARLSSTAIVAPAGSPPPAPPLELWPDDPARSNSVARSGVVWIEDDATPPAWNELDPLFQFLTARSVAVARLRLRGSDGFGRAFRHAADGRPLAAAVEDAESARSALARRGVDPKRVALVGVGGWPAAVVATLATDGVPTANRFAAYSAFGADPDPFARLDTLALLAEPARSWWSARLGAADAPGALAARLAARADRRVERGAGPAALPPLAPFLESAGKPDPEALWRHLSHALAPR